MKRSIFESMSVETVKCVIYSIDESESFRAANGGHLREVKAVLGNIL